MNIRRWKQLEKQVIRLVNQSQQDLQTLDPLIEIHEYIRGLPRPGKQAMVYTQIQYYPGVAFAGLPVGDRAANLQRAIVCFGEALRFLSLENAPLAYADIQSNLGDIYAQAPTGDRAANVQRAIACYEEALRVWTPETDPSAYAATQNNLGGAYAQLSTREPLANLPRAVACYEAALQFRTPEAAPDVCRRSNYNLANLYFAQKEWTKALETYQAAIQAGELLYRADLSAESKATEMTANAELYRNAAFSAVHCGEQPLALQILEQGKTRLLSEALRLHIARPKNVPDEVWTAYKDAAATVRSLQTSNPTRSGLAQDSAQTYAARAQAAHAATITLERAIAQVRIHAPDFLRTIDLRSAQALLPDNATCFVFFCITTQGSWGMLVTRHAQEVQVIEIPAFTQTDLIHLLVEMGDGGEGPGGWLTAYIRYLRDQTPAARDAWQETMEQVLDDLGWHLLDPILSTLPEDIEHLIFLPSAQLFLFPLHAVPLAGNRAERVCDRYHVSYTPSLEVLAHTRSKATQDVSPDFYAVINPQADSRLVFASRSGTALAPLFAHSTCDEGRTGTRRQVMTSVRGRTYLHFACHGSYDWDDPRASGLELADGRLTLAELEGESLDLSAARLVTLMACEVGITDIIQGSAEEYVGVPAGLMLAGVPAVVSSLWEVPDLSTALLMEQFYSHHLKGKMGFSAALREAQRWVRTLEIGAVEEYASQAYEQSGRKNATLLRYLRHYRALAKQDPDRRPFAHPYYWAAFTVSGW